MIGDPTPGQERGPPQDWIGVLSAKDMPRAVRLFVFTQEDFLVTKRLTLRYIPFDF